MPTSLMKDDMRTDFAHVANSGITFYKDTNKFVHRPDVQEFIVDTATTILEVALAILLFKLVVRVFIL